MTKLCRTPFLEFHEVFRRRNHGHEVLLRAQELCNGLSEEDCTEAQVYLRSVVARHRSLRWAATSGKDAAMFGLLSLFALSIVLHSLGLYSIAVFLDDAGRPRHLGLMDWAVLLLGGLSSVFFVATLWSWLGPLKWVFPMLDDLRLVHAPEAEQKSLLRPLRRFDVLLLKAHESRFQNKR